MHAPLNFLLRGVLLGDIESMNLFLNHIGCEMVYALASSVVYRGFEPRSGQTRDYEICICC